jgi:hypothetical protein
MPRNLKFDIDDLISIILSNKSNLINLKNGINPPASDCWNNISKELNYVISSKYIYTIVKLNRYSVRDKLLGDFDSATKLTINKIIDDEDSDVFSSDHQSENEDNILNFNITLSEEEWDSIKKPTETLYKRLDKKYPVRVYHTLKSHIWTPLIHEHFFLSKRDYRVQ